MRFTEISLHSYRQQFIHCDDFVPLQKKYGETQRRKHRWQLVYCGVKFVWPKFMSSISASLVGGYKLFTLNIFFESISSENSRNNCNQVRKAAAAADGGIRNKSFDLILFALLDEHLFHHRSTVATAEILTTMRNDTRLAMCACVCTCSYQ